MRARNDNKRAIAVGNVVDIEPGFDTGVECIGVEILLWIGLRRLASVMNDVLQMKKGNPVF